MILRRVSNRLEPEPLAQAKGEEGPLPKIAKAESAKGNHSRATTATPTAAPKIAAITPATQVKKVLRLLS